MLLFARGARCVDYFFTLRVDSQRASQHVPRDRPGSPAASGKKQPPPPGLLLHPMGRRPADCSFLLPEGVTRAGGARRYGYGSPPGGRQLGAVNPVAVRGVAGRDFSCTLWASLGIWISLLGCCARDSQALNLLKAETLPDRLSNLLCPIYTQPDHTTSLTHPSPLL